MCSKLSNKPLLPIHITKCNKGNKNHQAKAWRNTSDRRGRHEGRNSDRRGRKELKYTVKEKGSSSIQRVCGCCGWLWVKRERRRGLEEIGSEEGEIGFVGMVGID